MTELLLELLNISVPYISVYAIKLYPMWKTRDVKTWPVIIFICCMALYLWGGFLLVEHFGEVDFRVLQLYKLWLFIPNTLMSFWVFRGRVWQNVYLLSMSLMYGPISIGTGMYAGENWFAASAYPLLGANLVSLAVIALTLPPLLFFLRRLCENPDMKQTGIWLFIWLLPVLFFCMFLLSGSPFDIENFHGSGFLVIRALIYTAMLLTCYLLETTLRQVSENILLKGNARMTENQLALQREQYERLMQNAKTEKSMSHDLHHHLAVLGQLADSGDAGGIKEYVENLDSRLTAAREIWYCKNYAVNAVAVHYLGIAESEGVAVDAKLNIPEDTGCVPAMDLCVVMGNFLENAVEACRRMEKGNRFIRVRSQLADDTLSIVVSNSFDGNWREENGAYLSRKESGETVPREGVGLSSVKAVCEKYRGLARYEASGDIWKSSALVHMEEENV